MKKQVVFIIILVIIFGIFIYFYNRKSNYTLEYTIDDFEVIEEYNKDSKYYSFSITTNDITYNIVTLDDYINKRKLIDNIEVVGNCIIPSSEYVSIYGVCYSDGEYYTYKSNDSEFVSNDTYDNISINSLNGNTYLLWNYNGFIYISDSTKKTLELFDSDTYNISFVTKINDYLLVADYDQSYYFDKVYLINVGNASTTSINLRFKVYFDSYILGNYKNRVYLYDRKNEVEYYIDIKKSEIYKDGYKLYINGEWESTTNQKLKNNTLSFKEDSLINYVLDDNMLYLTYSDSLIRVSDRMISTIVDYNDFEVYYIADDTLYYFNPIDGESALLKYSEWSFNYNNMIFIF